MNEWAAIVLAFVFAVAARSKLRNRPDMRPLGLPQSTPVVVALVEIGLAIALVVWPANAGIAALVLLAGFTVFLAANVGSDTGCGCFGSTKVTRIRRVDLLRNVALLALAGIAAFA